MTAPKLTLEQMYALIERHGRSEQERDWQGAFDTMTDAPRYEFFPYRLRITSRIAIEEMWSRFFTESGPLRPFDPAAHVPGAHSMQEYVRDDSVLRISSSAFLDEAGNRRPTGHITCFGFVGDRIESETLWVDRPLEVYLDAVFDDEFRSLPGVTEF
jgi:hypothetical protein